MNSVEKTNILFEICKPWWIGGGSTPDLQISGSFVSSFKNIHSSLLSFFFLNFLSNYIISVNSNKYFFLQKSSDIQFFFFLHIVIPFSAQIEPERNVLFTC